MRNDGVVFSLGSIAVARQQTTVRWYFLSGPFWSCINEAVGQRVTAPVRVGGWLGIVASLPGRGGSLLLFSELLEENGNILDKSTRIAKG
jgi:hypothetical protein